MITVHVEPDNETLTFASLNTVLQLLNRLGLRSTQALVVRDGNLLTADRKLGRDDVITIKKVVSAG
ncbi:MAG: hypothetical protein V3573_07710 [Desulfovibrionaceae bacterium]